MSHGDAGKDTTLKYLVAPAAAAKPSLGTRTWYLELSEGEMRHFLHSRSEISIPTIIHRFDFLLQSPFLHSIF